MSIQRFINANKPLVVGGVALIFFLFARKASANTLPGPGVLDGSLMSISYLGTDAPRGIRNNNPGNIKLAANEWDGKIPASQNTDGQFEQFGTFVMGVRAMTKLLINYINAGHNTLERIIARWAPAADGNDPAAYARDISANTGLAKNEVLTPDYATLAILVPAMASYENAGRNAIDPAMFQLAWSLL